MVRLFAILPFIAFLAGCAHYEYDIARPTEFAQHVGTASDVTMKRESLEYRFRTVENWLVVRVYNPTDIPVSLDGRKSTVVDPGGQSHPFRDLTIAPGSFGKLIFPPMKPRLERQGPSIGFGIGTSFGDARRHHYTTDPFVDSFYNTGPRYLSVIDDDALYWDWDGETAISLTLVFERDNKTFTADFVINRRKM